MNHYFHLFTHLCIFARIKSLSFVLHGQETAISVLFKYNKHIHPTELLPTNILENVFLMFSLHNTITNEELKLIATYNSKCVLRKVKNAQYALLLPIYNSSFCLLS